MERIASLILLLSGLCSHCHYLLVKTPKTWYEAQSYCRENCLDLVTINNMGEMKNILTTFEGEFDDAVWIGLQKGSTMTWHWSLADNGFYKEGERSYFKWDTKPTYHCGAYQNGLLYGIPCDSLRYSICLAGQDQYVFTSTATDWATGQDYCRTSFIDLTSLRNDAEYQIVQELASSNPVWIGLFRDNWEWSDQTYSSFRYWPLDQKIWSNVTEECGAMLKNESGRWEGLPCSEKHPFLCKCKAHLSFIKVRINPQDSALDVNQPSVLEAILNKLKMDLNKTGTNGLQLQWRKQPDGRVFVKDTRPDD